MKFVPLSGYVDDNLAPDRRRRVDGFAFQIPGFEYLHTWATHYLGLTYLNPPDDQSWVVSHWETGLSISNSCTRAVTKELAAKRATKFLRYKGHRRVRARLKELGLP